MPALKIDIPGKPVLFVPAYDLAHVLLWLVQYLDSGDVDITIKSVDL